MFGIITTHIRTLSKIGSIASKIIGLGMTGFGLVKLWSQESTRKHSLPTIVAFSGAYVIHMSSTLLMTAVMFGSDTVSPLVASALLSGTSLLTSYVNLMEAYLTHSFLKLKCNVLETKLNASNLDLQRNLTLIQSQTDCDSQMQLLNEQLGFLRVIQLRLQRLKTRAELKEIYLLLYESYQERLVKNEIWKNYFREIGPSNDLESVLKDLREKIKATHSEIQDINTKLQIAKISKSKNRLQHKLTQYEQQLKELGVIDIQCIRYLKIEKQIKLLEKLLMEVNKSQTSDISKINELQYLEIRIKSLQKVLDMGLHPQDNLHAFDLEFSVTKTLDDIINDDLAEFKQWLENYLIQEIKRIETLQDDLELNIANIEKCFKEFINEPVNDILNQHLDICNIRQEKVQFEYELSLEKFNEESKKTKLNLSTIASLLALAMCLVPQGEISTILNPLMLGMGFVGGVSSMWNFYNKNLLTEKFKIQKQNKENRLNKAFKFEHTNTMSRTLSVKFEPRVVPPASRVSLPRKAKDKANELIFSDRKRSKSKDFFINLEKNKKKISCRLLNKR